MANSDYVLATLKMESVFTARQKSDFNVLFNLLEPEFYI